jgi:phosphatidate cytidylyltransferase
MALANNFANNSLVALLLMFIVPPFADMFAYWVGITLKGKKLCPKISPKKTISGAIGGLIGGVIGAIALYFIAKATGILVYNYVFPGWLAFGLIGLGGAFLCELGDLIESVIKRQLGIKDMGNLIPGHGGVMDRVDSIIFTAPFIYLIFVLI